MKVCEKCGEEIATKDGDNLCQSCENRTKKNKQAAANRKARKEAMESLGLKQVKGTNGGTFWE